MQYSNNCSGDAKAMKDDPVVVKEMDMFRKSVDELASNIHLIEERLEYVSTPSVIMAADNEAAEKDSVCLCTLAGEIRGLRGIVEGDTKRLRMILANLQI